LANTIRVHELAKELRKSNREVTDRLRKLEIPWKTNLSSITQEDANRVRSSFGRETVKIPKPKKAKKPAEKKPEKKPAAKKPAVKKASEKKAAKPAAKKAAAAKKPAAKKTTAAKKPAVKKATAKKAAVKATKPATAPEARPAVAVQERPATAAAQQVAHAPEKPAGPAAAAKVAEEPERKAPIQKKAVAPQGPAKAQAPPKAAAPVPAPAAPAGKPPAGKPPAGKPPARKETRRGLAAVVPVRRPAQPEAPVEKKPTLRVAPADRRGAPHKPAGEKKVYRFVPKGRRGAPAPRGAPSTVAPKFLRVPTGITVKDFAQTAGLTPGEVIRKMIGFGEMITVNQSIKDDAIRLLAEDLGIEIKIKASRLEELEDIDEIVEKPEDLVVKPPVVTVMGHVDHGKTRLLDAIRKTDVVSQEKGGITQHIGAYQVIFHGKPITFIDTPGHESFTAMRARGAQLTDIVVLVVAADDGVMPQTLEALDHAKEAEVPIIVAVNKIDKPDAEPHRVRQQLSERGLIPEEWGGETIFADISAKEGTNIDHMLEMILLVAELQELKANPSAQASGLVLEAKLDKARGPVATILVQRGTARIGEVFVAGSAWGKIRAMFNERGEQLSEAGPAVPVEMLGQSSIPMAGDDFRVVEDEKRARQIADRRRMLQKLDEQVGPRHVSLENFLERIKEGEAKELKLVIKADAQGSLEAIVGALEKLQQDEVKVRVIHSGVGGVTETDVMLASASEAIVLAFNVRPDSKAARVAGEEKVDVRTYQVIYKLTEDMESALVGMLAPTYQEQVEGRAEVRQTFRVPGLGLVAGCYVLEGEISRNSLMRLIRDGVVVYDGRVGSLRRFKDDVKSVAAGFECGIGLDGFQDIKEGDILEAYRMLEIARTSARTT